MVVLVIDIHGVAADKAKGDAPVPAHANCPSAFAISSERMQDETREIHIFGLDRNLKSTQYQSQPLLVLRLYSGFRALEKETLKPLMSKAPNHDGIVTRHATGYKTPKSNADRWLCDAPQLLSNQATQRALKALLFDIPLERLVDEALVVSSASFIDPCLKPLYQLIIEADCDACLARSSGS